MIKKLRTASLVLLFSIMMIEIVGYFIGSNDYFWQNRQLFVSKGGFRAIGQHGLWTYSPNTDITFAATYHLSEYHDWIEYLCSFKTNKFGLIETNFQNSQTIVDFLILGDSFTEGHGGCPWLTRDSIPETFPIIVNGGLQGTGIQSFELLGNWLAQYIEIKNVIIIAISNDFKRSPTTYFMKNKCINNGDCDLNNDWWGIDNHLSNDNLMKISRNKYLAKNESGTHQFINVLAYYSSSYQIYQKYSSILKNTVILGKEPGSNFNITNLFNKNFIALDRIRAKYPKLKIMLIPQKDEVGLLGVENSDSTIVRKYLEASDYNYTYCQLGINDYMHIDGHPNAKGYLKLFDCLTSLISTSK